MKLYISADIEGVACISAGAETDPGKPGECAPFQRQMTAEVAAACRGGFSSGVREVLIKDAHWTGRNIDPQLLEAQALVAHPQARVRLIRGWSGHPFGMVQDIDSSFAAAAFIGYHSASGSAGNPLSHTVSGGAFARVELNGLMCSEFLLYGYAAGSVGVPVGFVSGDAALCAQAETLVDGIHTVAVLRGDGASTVSMLPGEALRHIEAGVQRALSTRLPPPLRPPADLHLRLLFQSPQLAYAKSFFPGVRQLSDTELLFEGSDYLGLMSFVAFAAGPVLS